jgi:hypothetical protein
MEFLAMRFFIPFLLAVFAAAPAVQKNAPAPASSGRAAQEDDIREALFRYQFASVQLAFEYHFIAIDDKSPSKAFLDRFEGDTPLVRPISEIERVKKPLRMIENKRDQKPGIIFYQGPVKWISDTKVDIDGRFECGDSCDEKSGTFHLSKQGDRWVVTTVDNTTKPSS